MHIIIPAWFYGFDSLLYMTDAFIGFLLSFYFNRIFTLSSEKRHMYLHLGFLLFSIGLFTLSVTNAFTYLAFNNCLVSSATCTLGLLDDVFSLEDFAYFTYFGLTVFAYILFLLAYCQEYPKFSRFFIPAFIGYLVLLIALIPLRDGHVLWYSYRGYFNMTALTLLVFVSYKNIVHHIERKTQNSLLVAISFSFFTLYHVCHMFSFIGETYVLGHIFMLVGFIALLFMVMRVNKK